MEETGGGKTTGTSSTKSARKRKRKSRANGGDSTASVSGASGSAVDGSAEPREDLCLLIDVVCGLNRAKLRVDGLRNGSKTPCVYLETDTEELGQELGQGDGKDQPRSGELQSHTRSSDY